MHNPKMNDRDQQEQQKDFQFVSEMLAWLSTQGVTHHANESQAGSGRSDPSTSPI
jgi:hypothetical protein